MARLASALTIYIYIYSGVRATSTYILKYDGKNCINEAKSNDNTKHNQLSFHVLEPHLPSDLYCLLPEMFSLYHKELNCLCCYITTIKWCE